MHKPTLCTNPSDFCPMKPTFEEAIGLQTLVQRTEAAVSTSHVRGFY